MLKKRIQWLFMICLLVPLGLTAQVPLFPDDLDSVPISRDDTVRTGRLHIKPVKPAAPLIAAKASNKIDSVIQYAYTFIGDRYRRGGTGGKGFDCSGYTMVVFKAFGVKLPHTSAGQGLVGIDVSAANIQKGDLILFRGRNRRSKRIGHVGIVISEKGDPVRFIHSSTSEGVRIDRLDFVYYRSRFLKAVRIPALYQ